MSKPSSKPATSRAAAAHAALEALSSTKQAPAVRRRGRKAAKTYKPAPGAHLSQTDAAAVGTVIETIYQRRQVVVPQDLVREAKSQKSPIHHLFEWDNGKAAAAYRLDQARYLMRSIIVEVEDVPTRAFRNVVTDSSGKGYVPIQEAIEDVDLHEQIASAALRQLESWTVQYNVLQKLARFKPVFKAIEFASKEEGPVPSKAPKKRSKRGGKRKAQRKPVKARPVTTAKRGGGGPEIEDVKLDHGRLVGGKPAPKKKAA